MRAPNLDYIFEVLHFNLQRVPQSVQVGFQQTVNLLSHCYMHGRWKSVVGTLEKKGNAKKQGIRLPIGVAQLVESCTLHSMTRVQMPSGAQVQLDDVF